MAPKQDKSPKVVTIYGRLSYPVFEYNRAVQRNQTSQFKKADPAEVTPEFHLLVEEDQLNKLVTHVKQVFLPYCVEQSNKGEKRDALTQAEADRILKLIDSEDWDSQPPYIPIKAVGDKTTDKVPEAVASIKVVGNKGVDVELKAVVNDEDELINPDGSVIDFPTIVPIKESVHQMYAGAYVGATLNLYAFISGKLPGFSGSASTAVFKADGERLGGGVQVDEDEMFMD